MKKIKRLERFDSKYGRAYLLRTDEGEIEFMPSVTTVLSLVPQAGLQELEQKIGKEKLAEISTRAANRGTAMHKFLENFVICMKKTGDHDKCLFYTQRKSTDELLGHYDKPTVDKGRDFFYNIYYDQEMFPTVKSILMSEGFLYSEKVKFAGTADFMYIDQDGKVVMCDFKSASGIREGEVIHKYELQGSAYSLAFEELTGVQIDRMELWIANPDGVQKLVTHKDVIEERKTEFIDWCEKYHLMWEKDKIKELYLSTHKK